MALFKILRGNSSKLFNSNGSISSAVPFNDGYCYFTPDNKKFYIDWLDESGGQHRDPLNSLLADTLLSVYTDSSGNTVQTSAKLVGGTSSIINSNEEIPTSAVLYAKFDEVKRITDGLNNDKMDKVNPTGTGYFSLNRNTDHTPGEYSVAVGTQTTASGYASFAEGGMTIASAPGSHAEGGVTEASGLCSHAEGSDTKALGDYSHAEGYFTIAQGYGSHAEGGSTKRLESPQSLRATRIQAGVSSYVAIDSPIYTTASGLCSHAEGSGTTASGDSSHAEGWRTTAYGNYSHAEGDSTAASSDCSHAEGSGTIANCVSQHVEGAYNIIDTSTPDNYGRGKYVHIVGNGTGDDARSNALTLTWDGDLWHSGSLSHGNSVSATGLGAYSGGSETSALGDYSHAEGISTTAQGGASHSEGENTTTIGVASHAEGHGSIAQGSYSHAQNQGTIAQGDSQTAIGKFNVANNTSAFIIGNGTADDARSNMFFIDWNGHACFLNTLSIGVNATAQSKIADAKFYVEGVSYFKGNMTVTGNLTASTAPSNGNHLVNKKYVDDNLMRLTHRYIKATEGQTTFDFGTIGINDIRNYYLVYFNGLLLIEGIHYTVENNKIVNLLGWSATADDYLQLVGFKPNNPTA